MSVQQTRVRRQESTQITQISSLEVWKVTKVEEMNGRFEAETQEMKDRQADRQAEMEVY